MFDRLENPAALQLLWFVPLLAFLAIWLAKAQLKRIRDALGERAWPFLTSSLSIGRRQLKLTLELMILALMIFALARPQSGESKQKAKAEGIEVLLLVDVSQSMLAEDIRPNRLEAAKREIDQLLSLSSGDKFGIVAFAGSAVAMSPLTADRSAIQMFVDSLSPTAVGTQGTDFHKALSEAKTAFERGGADAGDEAIVSRLVLIFSDGEDNEKGALDAARELAKEGIRIFTVAVGSESGGPIPLRDPNGQPIGNLKDKSGKDVITKTVPDSLRELAKAGDGQFYELHFSGEVAKRVIADFQRLQKGQFDATEFTSYNESYQIYLALAFILALIELALGERQSRGRLWKGRFEVAEQ